MNTDIAQLEVVARKLEALPEADPDSLARLCEVYWKLGRQDDSVAAYRRLLTRSTLKNEEFDAIYLDALVATGTCPSPVQRRDRLVRLIGLLREASAAASGEVVECGCFQGLSSSVMCRFLRLWNPGFSGAGYHIFDSFQGLSEPTLDDDIPDAWANASSLRLMTRRGNFAASLDQVQANLHDFPDIAYHPGWIPLSFGGLPDVRYRFVHVDVDLYDPTLDAFRYFYPRLARGGILVSDDYSWPGARTAIDEFCAEHGLQPDIIASNQAVIRKH
jgi:predicted O-methyltransferase YrrM